MTRDARELPASLLAPRRVLVVEDEDRCWRVVDRCLRRFGWRCERATSVAEARASLGGCFDAILLDLNLGAGGRGEEILELLAVRHAPMAVIVLSGCGTPGAANALGLDGVAYLEKPFAPATLLATLDEEVELTRLVIARGLIGLVARLEKKLLRAILGRLRATNGNQRRVALELALPRTTLRDKMEIYGLRSVAFERSTKPGPCKPDRE